MCFSNDVVDVPGKFQVTVCVNSKVFGSFLTGYIIITQMEWKREIFVIFQIATQIGRLFE